MDRLYQPTTMLIAMTNHCPFECYDKGYCFRKTSEENPTWIDDSRLDDIFGQAHEAGIMYAFFGSAEPFLKIDILESVIQKATKAGIRTTYFATTGFFGNDYSRAVDYFQRVKEAGFSPDDSLLRDPRCSHVGIGFSIDMFHTKIPPEHAANALLAYLEVFGPTIMANIKRTGPLPKYDDSTNVKRALKFLVNSGKVKNYDPDKEQLCFPDGSTASIDSYVAMLNPDIENKRELEFHDGSRVFMVKYGVMRCGYGEKIPHSMLPRIQFTAENMHCKDFFEGYPIPFHIFYISPTLDTYPELMWHEVFHGGNLAEITVQEAIDNIDHNPLTPIFMAKGPAGLADLLNRAGHPTPLIGSQPCDACSPMMKHYEKDIRAIKEKLSKNELSQEMRLVLLPIVIGLRERLIKRLA